MKRLWTIIISVGSPALAIFAFMANQSADDTQKNVTSYANSPFLWSVLRWLYGLVSSLGFLAFAFFVLGCVVTVLLGKWRRGLVRESPVRALAAEMSYTAYALDNMSAVWPNQAVIAKLNVVVNKMAQHGYAVPPAERGFNRDKFVHYLHQVAAYAKEGNEVAAKQVAQSIVDRWSS